MASSRKSPRSKSLLAHVGAVLQRHVRRGDRLVAGLSGGVDSVVLIDVLRRLSKRLHFELAALHVNHQINRAAGRWTAFCRAFCRQHSIAFTVVRVTVPRGASLEAQARAVRYRAFAVVPADFVALAHNLDDQAETVFLQLLRGAGVKGLSAMPVISGQRSAESASRVTPHVLRPLLDIPRSEIEAYARSRKLAWIEDDSNADIGFDRNFIRHRVLPVIAQRYPAYRQTVLRASRNCAEAAQLLDETAAQDGAACLAGATLAVEGLRRLPQARARNLLRYFLAGCGISMPSAERLAEALRQALLAKDDARVCIGIGGAELRRFAGVLHVVPKMAAVPAKVARVWRGERELGLPELGGVLRLDRRRGKGISLAKLQSKPVTIRVRRGGERLQPACGRPRRSLKNLLQEGRVPPWQRERAPLIFCGEKLVWAPGIGVDCAFQAQPGERALLPDWKPLG